MSNQRSSGSESKATCARCAQKGKACVFISQEKCQECLKALSRCDVIEAPTTRSTSNNQQHQNSNAYSHSSGRNFGPTSGSSPSKAPASSASFDDAALINSIKSSVDRLGNNREARFQQSGRERIRITKENEELKRSKKDSEESLRVVTQKFEENERKIGILTQNERKNQNQLKDSEDKYAQLELLYNNKSAQSDALRDEVEVGRVREEELQQKIKELEEKIQEVSELEEEIERNDALIGVLQKQIDSYKESLKSVETLRQQEKSRAEAQDELDKSLKERELGLKIKRERNESGNGYGGRGSSSASGSNKKARRSPEV